jgi:hypothetical protein
MSTQTESDWYAPSRVLPAEGEEVVIIDSGGTVSEAKYIRGLWFITPEVHIYYVPTFWKPRYP